MAPKESASFKESSAKESLLNVFFTKLKDQSFTIILMIGILYYQNIMWNKDHQELQARITDLDKQVKDCEARERKLYEDKENALRTQREEFLKILREKQGYYLNTAPIMMTQED